MSKEDFDYRRLSANLLRSVYQQKRNMKVIADKVLADNYMYYVVDEHTHEAFVVDLGDSSKISTVEKDNEIAVKAAFITHHHWDHSAAAQDFAKDFPNAKIYGQDKERIPALSDEVENGQDIEFSKSIQIHCISTPGHTTSHVCYYVYDKTTNQQAVFTGDTLFLAGCGKFFECEPVVMHDTISKLLDKIDDNTEMYFGHEYSVNNLLFAHRVEPQNKNVIEKLDECKQLLNNNKFTCPSKWSEEKLYNPFLRIGESAVKDFTKATDPIEVLGKLREAKNNFKA